MPSRSSASTILGIIGGQNCVTFGAVPPYYTSSWEGYASFLSSSGSVLSENNYLLTATASKKDYKILAILSWIQVRFTTTDFFEYSI